MIKAGTLSLCVCLLLTLAHYCAESYSGLYKKLQKSLKKGVRRVSGEN